MTELKTMTYEVDGRVARITFDRPRQGNSITLDTPGELAWCVERACLDRTVHVIALSGRGPGFCGGYDLSVLAEHLLDGERGGGTPLDPGVVAENHDPSRTWDPMTDFQFMARCTRAWTSLLLCDKPAVVKVHGFAVAGGSDIALCADLMVIAADAKLGYPPLRAWGVPSVGLWAHKLPDQRAKRLLFTGDSLSGTEALEWGLAAEAPPAEALDERFEALVARIARLPVNQLMAAKLAANQALMASGVFASQTVSVLLDGVSRHTAEGYGFATRAAEVGFRQAVRERDEPFGDAGRSTFKG